MTRAKHPLANADWLAQFRSLSFLSVNNLLYFLDPIEIVQRLSLAYSHTVAREGPEYVVPVRLMSLSRQ